MAGIDFTEEAVVRARGYLLHAPRYSDAKESKRELTLCPLILLLSLPEPELESEAAKSTHRWIPEQRQPGFWLLSHLDTEQDQQKDPRRQRCPSSSPSSPSALWVGGNLQTIWCKTSNFPNNTRTHPRISTCPSTPFPPTNCCLLKRDQHSSQT